MNTIEKNTEDFIGEFHQYYVESEDIERILDMLDDQIIWIGDGGNQIFRGTERMREYLENNPGRRSEEFSSARLDMDYQALGDTLCMAYGILTIDIQEACIQNASMKFWVSAICEQQTDRMRLKKMHISASGGGELRKYMNIQSGQLIQKNNDLNALIQNLPGGVMCCENSDDLELIEYSDGFLKMFGYTAKEIKEQLHSSFRKLIYPEDMIPAWISVNEQMKHGNSKKIEYRAICKDGNVIVIQDHGQLVQRKGKEVFYCILTDITEQRKALEELKLSLERHRIIMEQTTDIIFEYDFQSGQMLFSDNWEKKFGYKPYTTDSVGNAIRNGHIPEADREALLEMKNRIYQLEPYAECEIRFLTSEGRYIWCRIRTTLQTDKKGEPKKAVGVIIDIDAEKKKTQMLRIRADRDMLTGLYNKGAVESRATAYLEMRREDELCALMLIDLDNFKYVNDEFGHVCGDRLLADFARALKGIFRKDDIVGRVGGDEFGIVIRDIPGREAAEKKAEEIIRSLKALSEQRNYCVSCSIGIAFGPSHGKEFLDLYRKADFALYQVKEHGKNGYRIFNQSMGQD